MIGRQIRCHSDMRAFLHGHELERTQFQHRRVLRRHFRRIAQQRVADVASHMNNFPLRRQQLGDNGCGGSLSIGAGHGQNRAGADLKKRLHFRGDDAAPCRGGGQLRHIRPQARGAEDDILVNVLQIILPQLQLAALRGQFCAQLAQTLLFIPGGHGHALFQQLFDEGPVRYADADDTHRFPPQRGQICFKIHITLLIS